MFVNAILHQEVPVFREKRAKFFLASLERFLPSGRLSGGSLRFGGYKNSAYERPASARRHFPEFTLASSRICSRYCEKRHDVRQQTDRKSTRLNSSHLG